MKSKLLLLLILLQMTLGVTAQTQQGYVKTLGRPEKQGEALEGVTLRVKGNHNTVVSDPNGKFSLLLTDLKNGDAYSLQRVQKNGYELNEIDFIGRKLAFSDKVPLTIVMVSTEQLQADKQRIENTAFATAQKNYTAKMSLIEKQLKDNEITKEQYQAAINDLQDKFEKYQSLIDGLATHYAHTDYDELDEKDREINLCIENGDLERADSLIRTLFDPIDVLQRNMEALADIEQQIGQARGIINQANADMEAVLKQQEKDAEYLYQLYTIAAARFDNEKAMQYIETRAELDTTRWEWQYDAGSYCFKQNLIGKAEKYYNRALDYLDEILKEAFDSDIKNTSKEDLAQMLALSAFTYVVENNLAFIYYKANRFAESEELYLEIIDFYKGLSEHISAPEVANDLLGGVVVTAMNGLSNQYKDTYRFEGSTALCQEALEIMRKLDPNDAYIKDKEEYEAKILMTQGLNYKKGLRYKESEKCFKEALKIHRRIAKTNPDNEVEVARTLHNYGNLCSDMKRYDESEAMLLESLEIYRRWAKANPQAYENKVGSVIGDLALTYNYLGQYEKSESLYKEAIEIKRRWAKFNPTLFESELALSLGNLGSLYLYYSERYAEAIPPLEEAFEIYQRLSQAMPEVYGEELSISKFNLAGAYYKSGQIKKSLPFWVETIDEIGELANNNPDKYKENYETTLIFIKNLAPWLESEASNFKDEGNYEESAIYYESALDMYRWLAKSDPKTYEPEIAGTLNSLGVLYANGKQYNKSEVAFSQSLETYQRLAKTDPKTYQSETFRMRNNLAALEVNKAQDYNGKKQYEEAAACYVKVIEIRKALAKEDHISNYNYDSEVASALNSLAIVYVNLNRYQESEAAFKESLEIYQRLSQTDAVKYESLVTQALNNLSILASQLRKKASQNKEAERYEESQAMLSQALNIYKDLAETNPTKYNPEITATLAEIEQIRKLLKK